MRRLPIVMALVATLCAGGRASAQPAPPEPESSDAVKAAARTLASKGIQLFEEGHYAEAYAHLDRAQAVFPAPVHLVYMARAQAALGKLLAARRLYQQALAEPAAADAPPAIRETRKAAKDELDAMRRRIPTLAVRIAGAPSARVTLSIDGAATSPPGGRAELDPGEHVVEAVAEGSRSAKRTVVLREGEAVEIELRLGRETPASRSPDTGPAPAPRKPTASLLPAAIAFAVGGAALGVGTITGAMSLAKVGDLKDRCVGTHCPFEDRDEAHTAQTLATVSTIGFVVAGLGIGSGIALLIIRPGTASPVVASVGPGTWAVRGGF